MTCQLPQVRKPFTPPCAVLEGFNTAQVRVSATFQQKGYDIDPQEIRIGEIKIKCPEFDCGSCDKGCGTLDLGCKAKEVACETFKRKPCLVAKAASDEACHLANVLGARLRGIRLGTARFKDVKAGGKVSTTTMTLNLDDTLNNATLKADQFEGDLRASGELFTRESLEVVLAQLMTGTLGLCLPIQRITADNIRVLVVTDTLHFDTKFEKANAESVNGMGLKLKIENANLKVKTNLNPLLDTLDQNPHLFITCPLGATTLTVAGVVNTIFPIPISFDQNVPKLTSFDVGEIRLDIPGTPKPLILVPHEGELSLGVVEKR